MKLKLLITTGLACITFGASANLSVVVHPSMADTLDNAMISKIFLGKSKTLPGGQPVTPVNLKAGDPLRVEFDKLVLKKSASQIKSYWSKQLFTGKGKPPKEEPSSDAIIQLIKDNPKLIGYIESSKVTGDLKVIATF